MFSCLGPDTVSQTDRIHAASNRGTPYWEEHRTMFQGDSKNRCIFGCENLLEAENINFLCCS